MNAPQRDHLASTIVYAALASVGTGVVLNGVYFITAELFAFSDTQNLLLGICIQIPYIPAAVLSGRLSRALGARRLLLLSIVGMSAACAILAMLPPQWAWWLLAPLYNAFAGVQWPVVESYVASGRHGRDMRRAIGKFNIAWAGAIAPGLWLISLFHGRPATTFAVLGVLHLLTLPLVVRWNADPAPHDAEGGRAHQTDAYPHLLRSARIVLPVSYVLMNMMYPLLPELFRDLGVDERISPTLGSTPQVVRVALFVAFFAWTGWHGRWLILSSAGVLLFGGALTVFLAPTTTVAVAGMVGFGIGQAMTYYAALYYGMAVGAANIDSGGTHEAVIGLGYVAGPGFGLLGKTIAAGALGAAFVTGGLAIATGVAASLPWLAWRRRRRITSPS